MPAHGIGAGARRPGACFPAEEPTVYWVKALIAASAEKALEIMHREPERTTRLRQNAALFQKLARKRGLSNGHGAATAVCPIMTGDSLPAAMLSQKLFERGINVQPILYPAVEERAARLRFFITSKHSEEQIRTAVNAVAEELARIDPKYIQTSNGERSPASANRPANQTV